MICGAWLNHRIAAPHAFFLNWSLNHRSLGANFSAVMSLLQKKIKTPAPAERRIASGQAEETVGATRTEGKKMSRTASYIEYKNAHPAMEVALYYGFTPLAAPLAITKKDKDRARELEEYNKTEPFSIAPTLEEKIALLRYYEEKNLHVGPQPAMFCSEFLVGKDSRKKPSERLLSLDIIGSGKSIAEATLIQTAFAALREAKHEHLTLYINSVGDRESTNQFARELGNYYRKYAASLPHSCKTLLRVNPFELLKCNHEKCRALAMEAPQSVSFLGEGSRRHFREVLEFLEELDIPYQIDHTLCGSRAFATETFFEIRETTPEGSSFCLCSGVRYNALGKRLGLGRDTPSIGLNLTLPQTEKGTPSSRSVRIKRPSVFFLQLGFCAKLKSLRVVEVLRKARIPIHQALCRDKLVSQLSSAENLRIPFSIILGQREALENSVIIRNTSTRSQETVKLPDLVSYLRKMKLG